MKGDFSQRNFDPQRNYHGVLHQQGRVLLDQDWNAETDINRHLRELLGQDVVGQDIIGIPAAESANWMITGAQSDGEQVEITLNTGRGWIDGLLLYIPEGDGNVTLPAAYFGPPIESPVPGPESIASGIRDAVVLEAWEEAYSAFQAPVELLEPALGGPDTTARSKLFYRLRLLRLRDGEDCGNVSRMVDDASQMGRLSVTPSPAIAITGDCPVQAGGGYSGFEHHLYRIEIARPSADGEARFKYSRFNGGLVGRGTFDNALDQLTVLANDQMINQSGLDSFFLEVLSPDPSGTYWSSVMEADASAVSNGVLSLTNIRGAWPGAGTDEAFFRLWDGVDLVQSYSTGGAIEFELGLRLAFDAPLSDNRNYRPGDYWTLPLRTASTSFDPSVWPDNAPPQGVVYHRAPLGVLHWPSGPVATLAGPPGIHDCRRIFQPLTKIQTCCTYKVGDGLHSFGDFDSIQAAIDHLPPSGGEICVLPGRYHENVEIDKDNVRIHGCGPATRVMGTSQDEESVPRPVFSATGRNNIRIESMHIIAAENGIGVLIRGETQQDRTLPCRLARLRDLQVFVRGESAIKLLECEDVLVSSCHLRADDVSTEWSPLFVLGLNMLIEHNDIRVIPSKAAGTVERVQSGRGGIHIAGTSEDITLVDNDIVGGIGHGITLGTVDTLDPNGNIIFGLNGWVISRYDPCDPCAPGGVYIPPGGAAGPDDRPVTYQSAGALFNLVIERNRINYMGLCAIGVVGFFNLDEDDEFISVYGLDILGNTLKGNLWRDLEVMPDDAQEYMGYGAIGLADVESLRIYDNLIENNGPDHLQPICGIFVLHAEGVDICRNRIRNNGMRTQDSTDEVVTGRRGGIVIPYALPGIDAMQVGGGFRPRQNGVPAARIHDNIVSQPLGQALAIGGMGPMSVQGNQLTSQAFVQAFGDVSFLATTVMILNLGVSNEFYLQTLLFRGATADPIDVGDLPTNNSGFIPTPTRGLDDQGIGRYLANGNVIFCDNQVFLDLTEPEVSFAVSQTAIISLDDVSVQNNQFDCDYLVDIMFTNLLTVGMTTRVQDNRFKETLMIAMFSSINLGLLFNNTSDNQATHCMLNLESPIGSLPFVNTSIRQHDNQVLFNAINFLDFWCEALGGFRNILVRNDDEQSDSPEATVTPTNNFNATLNAMWRG